MSHPIPDDVLTDHLGVLAKTGAGKTYLAKGIVERLLAQKKRVCIIDPKDAYWGLKSSADGKSPGFPVIIFGGPHADVPLLATHGKVLGEAVATTEMQCVICTKGMPEAERIRFLTDFFQTIDQKNSHPIHLIIDEAHMMAPQKPLGEMQRLTHWTSELVSGGRGMGIRVILLSQRPARLNKDVLTQCEALVAMRMTGPQDRDAVKAWIEDHADKEKGKEIIASLPSLPTGEGWFWAPTRGILKRVKFPAIQTYDSSKTAKDGKADAKATLAPVDLEALQVKLGKAKADIDANDPKALKARVADLEKQLRTRAPTAPSAPAVDLTHEKSLAFNAGWAAAMKDVAKERAANAKVFANLRATLERAMAGIPTSEIAPPQAPSAPLPIAWVERRPTATAERREPTEGVTRPQQKVLDALAWWLALGKESPTVSMIAVVCGWRPSSTSTSNRVSELVTAGYVARNGPGTASLTGSGRSLVDIPEIGSQDELHRSVRGVLTAPQIRAFDVMIAHYPEEISVKTVANEVGWEETSTSTSNRLSELCTMDIVTRPKPGIVRAADWLFVE